jgi:hypothetical protein
VICCSFFPCVFGFCFTGFLTKIMSENIWCSGGLYCWKVHMNRVRHTHARAMFMDIDAQD